MMTKPQSESPMDCPLWRAPCREKCHKCEFYVGLPTRDGKTSWECSVPALVGLTFKNMAQLDGIHTAAVDQREAFGGFRDAIMKLIATLGRVMIPREFLRPQALIEDKSDGQKLLSHQS